MHTEKVKFYLGILLTISTTKIVQEKKKSENSCWITRIVDQG